MTEDKIVLKFLHDAFYYYLLNRGNTREHLHVSLFLKLILVNERGHTVTSLCRQKTAHFIRIQG